jgi:hypothetical protein
MKSSSLLIRSKYTPFHLASPNGHHPHSEKSSNMHYACPPLLQPPPHKIFQVFCLLSVRLTQVIQSPIFSGPQRFGVLLCLGLASLDQNLVTLQSSSIILAIRISCVYIMYVSACLDKQSLTPPGTTPRFASIVRYLILLREYVVLLRI